MSVIRVWTTDGRWSGEIKGLDKVYLIKEAILQQYAPEEQWESTGYDECLNGFELDGQPISPEDFDGNWYVNENWVYFWTAFQGKVKISLPNVKTFTLPIVVLHSLQRKDPSLSDKYGQILSAAKTPAALPRGFCLLLRFENE